LRRPQVSDLPGYVYVIQNVAWRGWVKVGHVLGTGDALERVLTKRLSNYNVADPHKRFEVAQSFYAACAVTAERFAHDLLEINHRRGEGEWFRCDPEEALRLADGASAIARLRPAERGRRFDLALEEERQVALSDTQKINLENVAKKDSPPDVAETARAARQIIDVLLEELEKADDYISTDHSRNIEAAAKAVQRRLESLE